VAERFSSNDEVETIVQNWVKTLVADFFGEGTQKFVPQYDKCLNLGGDYVEKLLKACKLVKMKKYLKCYLSVHLQPIGTYFPYTPRIISCSHMQDYVHYNTKNHNLNLIYAVPSK
jgi:hypothetical protein